MAARKRDPLNDDDTPEIAKANEAAVEKVRPEPEEKDKEEDPVISLDEEDDDEPDEPKQSRAEKKQERKRILDELEEQRRIARESQAILQQAHERERQYLAQQRQQPQEDPQDRMEREALEREQNLLMREIRAAQALGGKADPKEIEELNRRTFEFEHRKAQYHANQAIRQRMGDQQQIPVGVQMAQQRWPDMFEGRHSQALAWAVQRSNLAMVEKGRELTWDERDEIVNEARGKFRMPTARARRPDASMAGKLNGHSRGAGGAAGGKSFVMTKSHRADADAAYAHIKDKNLRYKTYVKQVGRKLLEASTSDEE